MPNLDSTPVLVVPLRRPRIFVPTLLFFLVWASGSEAGSTASG